MAAGDSIWKYTAAGLAWSLVPGAVNLFFRPNAASAGLPNEEFRSQLFRRLVGCMAPALLFFVLLAIGGFVSAVLAPDLSQYEERAIPQFGRIYLEYVVPYAVANFFCVPAVVSITTEIASMRLSRELDALEVLGLDPSEVAFVPKAIALILVAPLFCFVIVFCGMAGVWAGSNFLLGISFLDFAGVFVSDVRSATYVKTLIKVVLIAFCMATVAGTFGFWPKREEARNLVGSLTALALTIGNLAVTLINLLLSDIEESFS
ncbi:MAG TPA: ABC transporter permease [Terrimicrobiaceae bacterium]